MLFRVFSALVFCVSLPLFAREEWVRLTTPHFEMLTTAGEKKGREAILYFEQVRSFFIQASPKKQAPQFPVRIVAFRSEKEYAPYRPNESAIAYYHRDRSRDSIVMEDIQSEHFPVAIHEYTHLIIEHSGLKLPVWMNEGWAELYSTLRPQGKQALVGDIPLGRLQILRTEKWLDLATVTSVDRNSPLYNEKNKSHIFYSEAWALMHMLYLSDAYRPNFTKFVVTVANGKTTAEAFESVYGRSLADVQKDLNGYVLGSFFHGALFDIKLAKSEEDADVSTPLSFEVQMALADLLAGRKPDEARQRYEQIAKENPGRPEVEESLGYLAWRDKDIAGAREHFAKAIAAGTKNPQMCFHYAMLDRRGGDLKKEAIPALDRALELKPDYLEARLELGMMYLNMHEWNAALINLATIKHVDEEHAHRLFSGLAYADMHLGDAEAARKNAELAKKYAATDDEKRQSDELLRYLDRTPASRPQ
ncbi:MAG TPA: tetratricopeptide repeat protein [Bryobacteraceae bacterium]|nr:tetratricopeptide repeat protein [Bryobacteraceae bacterium]